MKYDIRNRGRKIGTIQSFEYNVKKVCLLTATVGSLAVIIPSGFHIAAKNKVKEPVPIEESYDVPVSYHIYDPLDGTYKIKYKVNFGDTLYGLVTSYCGDADKVNFIIDEIVRDRDNDIESAGAIRQGKEYTLYGVPEDHLSDFGYFVPNREELSDEDKIKDDIEFITTYVYGSNKYKFNLDEKKYGLPNIEFANEVKDELIGLIETYRGYVEMEESEEKEKASKELLLMLDGAKTDIELLFGDEFMQPAYPLNEYSKSL